MELMFDNTNGVKKIIVRTDSRLDLAAFNTFAEAAALAVSERASAIVVDLENTRQILDSGESMLLFLHYKCGNLKDRVYMINARPNIMHKLTSDSFPLTFALDESTSAPNHLMTCGHADQTLHTQKPRAN